MKETGRANGRLGILVGGGPAPGINGVIAAATEAARAHGLEVIGISQGFKWLAQGDVAHTQPLTVEQVEHARLHGGSLLGTSRHNPTQDEAQTRNVVNALRELRIEHLVTIGGDDTVFSASRICQMAAGQIKVAHVPKTIDNDLPLRGGMPTFGFETARHVGAQLVAGLLADARTTQRWYLVVTMGRSAGFLALGIGTVAGASLTLIPEEFSSRGNTSLGLICDTIEGAMIKARALGRAYGVAVVSEGIGGLLGEELKGNPLVLTEKDEFGHPRLAEVPLALVLKRVLKARANNRGEKLALVDVTLGYELRCADPVSFDVEYAQQLGWGAVRYLLGTKAGSEETNGAMICVQDGQLVNIPFYEILDPATGRTRVRRVDINHDQYRCARGFMTRLERGDFQDEARLAQLASAAGLSTDNFRASYGHVVDL